MLEPQSSALGRLATSAMAGVEGFEPSSTVLETAALPLNYTPIKKMVRVTGVEPALVGTRS